MTVAERPPVFVASGKGFKCTYPLTFTTDLVHEIYLLGSLQGDPIAAKTLSVDNTANSTVAMVNIRGDTTPVAPFTLAYIGCDGQTSVQITGGTSNALISVDVLTEVVKDQTIVKKSSTIGGLPPIVLNGGPLNLGGTPQNIVPLNSGVTAYCTITAATGGPSNVKWGFTSACSDGVILNGQSGTIPMDSSTRTLWVTNDVGLAVIYYLAG